MTGDYLFFNNLAKEMAEFMLGGKINRVSEPNASEIVLGVYSHGEVFNLHLSASPESPHFRFGSGKFANPDNCPSFCMYLRKHLTGGEITSFDMAYDDRILKIEIVSKDDMHYSVGYTVILEIMSRCSNIIITDDKNIIRECLHHGEISEKTRTLLPGFAYQPPVNKKIHCRNTDKIFEEILKLGSIAEMCEFVKSSCAGIGKAGIAFIKEFVADKLKTKIDEKSSNNSEKDIILFEKELDDTEKTEMANIVLTAIKMLLFPREYGIYQPCVMLKTISVPNDNAVKNRDKVVDCYYVLPKENYDTTDALMHAINIIMEANYVTKEIANDKKPLFSMVNKLQQKVEQKIEYCKKSILDSEKADIYKKYGETIINNIYLIKEDKAEHTLMDYETNTLISVPFDTVLSVSQNAKRYFTRYNKLKRTRENNELRVLKLGEDMAKFGAILYEISEADSVELLTDIKCELIELGIIKAAAKKKKGGNKVKTLIYNARNIKQYSINDFSLLVGRNNIQNNEITFNLARGEDIWLHIKGYHGSHCMLKTDGKSVPDDVLTTASEICAYHSEGKLSPKCEIDYTEKTNVKRHPSKVLGLVNYVSYKTILVTPCEHNELLKKV